MSTEVNTLEPATENTATPAPPAAAAEPDEIEVDGVVVAASVTVQCLSCASMLHVDLVNSDPADNLNMDDHFVECPTCSEALTKLEGAPRKAILPIALLAGVQVAIAIPDGRLPFLDGGGKVE